MEMKKSARQRAANGEYEQTYQMLPLAVIFLLQMQEEHALIQASVKVIVKQKKKQRLVQKVREHAMNGKLQHV